MSFGKATAEPSQITDLIFIGSNRHAASLATENPFGIRAVLNVGTRQYEQADSIEYKSVPLEDAGPVSRDDFLACIGFIKTHVGLGSRILIHCNAGRNRSAAIIIGYLLAAEQCPDWDDAFEYVKSRRECVGCHPKVKESVLLVVLS